MQTKKTDNSHFWEKIKLRQEMVDRCGHIVRVLDCYAGKGLLWKEIQKRNPDKEIQVLSIEKEKGKNPEALTGDNLKIIPTLDLTQFDIIDLDAYGLPFDQVKLVVESDFVGLICVTFIQSLFGALRKNMVEAVGLDWAIYRKCQSLFNPYASHFFFDYLAKHKVSDVRGYFLGNKKYFYFYKN